jgi:hypothetical protein
VDKDGMNHLHLVAHAAYIASKMNNGSFLPECIGRSL